MIHAMDAVSEPIEIAPSLLEQHLAINSDPCPMCGYNLHRLRGSACPECGQALELRVAATTPRLGAFYTGLIGLAAGFGFTAFAFIYGVASMLWYSMSGMMTGTIVLLTEMLILGALMILWLRNSRQIRQAPAIVHWGLACGTWIASLAALAIFSIAIG